MFLCVNNSIKSEIFTVSIPPFSIFIISINEGAMYDSWAGNVNEKKILGKLESH